MVPSVLRHAMDLAIFYAYILKNTGWRNLCLGDNYNDVGDRLTSL